MKIRRLKIDRFISVLTVTGGLACFMPQLATAASSESGIEQLQNKVVSDGVVKDAHGEPVIGATVIENGTTNGTVTDQDGRFTLRVSPKAQLTISFVGFESQVISAGSNLTIVLVENSKLLDDVVVIGYGQMKKSDLTSSITSINGKVITQSASSSIKDALQGRIPGMDIQADRYEGENRSMYIRGTRSLKASNTPLVIVDGVPGSMNDINPQDIASIEVMKDASSAAIYGSQGANGVIIVSTKHGQSGKTKISVDSYYGIQKPGFINLIDGDRFVQMKRDAYLMGQNLWTPGNKGTVDDSILFTDDEMAIINSGNYVDWFDLIYRNGSTSSHTINISGGNDRTQFKLLFGYTKSKGYVKTNETDSYQLSTNIDHSINKYVKVGASLRYRYRNNSGFATYGQGVMYGTPVTRPYDDEGNVIAIPNTNEGAYSVLLNYQDGQYYNDQINQEFNVLGYLHVQFTDRFSLHSNVGYTNSSMRSGYFYGADSYTSHGKNKSGRSAYGSYQLTNNNTLSYSQSLGSHKLIVDLVQETQRYEYDNLSASGENADVEKVAYYNLGINTENQKIGSGYSGWSLASFMGRVRYDYAGKYLFNASVRADGSSRLADGHKWGSFLSAGVAWRLSSEEFMKDVNWISNLKLRLSYGEVGNQAISPYQTLSSLDSYPVLFGSNGLYAYRPSSITNKELGWEKTRTFNLGIDFGFFNDRLSGSIDAYIAKTSDLLMQRAIPITIGYSSIADNIGSTENRGIELSLNGTIVDNRNWNVSAFGNISYNKNKITKLSTDEDDITNGWFIGRPISQIYNYKMIGIWQIGEEEEAKKYNCIPGDVKIEDVADTTEGITADDKQFIGQRDPKVIAAFGINVQYKGFDFSATASGRFGHLISHDGYGYNLIMGGNRWCADVDYWTPDNPTNRWPRASSDIANRSLCAYFKGDYLKLQDITIGYDFASILNKSLRLNLSKARTYFQCRNIGYLYKAAGYGITPESTSLELTVPQTFTFGVNLNF